MVGSSVSLRGEQIHCHIVTLHLNVDGLDLQSRHFSFLLNTGFSLQPLSGLTGSKTKSIPILITDSEIYTIESCFTLSGSHFLSPEVIITFCDYPICICSPFSQAYFQELWINPGVGGTTDKSRGWRYCR